MLRVISDLSIDAGGNDDNTSGGRGGLEWGGMGEGSDESLRRRVETLSEKMKQRIQREMVWVLKMAVRWCVYDVVRSLFFQRRRGLGIDDWTSCALYFNSSIL